MTKSTLKAGATSAPMSGASVAQDDAPRFTGPFAEKELLSVREFCAAFGMGPTRAYELMKRGEIESVLMGQSRRITRRSAEAFLARLPRNPATAA